MKNLTRRNLIIAFAATVAVSVAIGLVLSRRKLDPETEAAIQMVPMMCSAYVVRHVTLADQIVNNYELEKKLHPQRKVPDRIVIATPELDQHIRDRFKGRDFGSKPLSPEGNDVAILQEIYSLFPTKAPEIPKYCDSFAAAYRECPARSEPAERDACLRKTLNAEVEKFSAYLQRNVPKELDPKQ